LPIRLCREIQKVMIFGGLSLATLNPVSAQQDAYVPATISGEKVEFPSCAASVLFREPPRLKEPQVINERGDIEQSAIFSERDSYMEAAVCRWSATGSRTVTQADAEAEHRYPPPLPALRTVAWSERPEAKVLQMEGKEDGVHMIVTSLYLSHATLRLMSVAVDGKAPTSAAEFRDRNAGIFSGQKK
jgi:hypothetical protein